MVLHESALAKSRAATSRGAMHELYPCLCGDGGRHQPDRDHRDASDACRHDLKEMGQYFDIGMKAFSPECASSSRATPLVSQLSCRFSLPQDAMYRAVLDTILARVAGLGGRGCRGNLWARRGSATGLLTMSSRDMATIWIQSQ